jgi:hypothetical protein
MTRRPCDSDPAGDIMTVRRRVYDAARTGAICGGCGRQLDPFEVVWRVPVAIGRRLNGRVGYRQAPVGRECVGTDLLRTTEGHAPEQCAGCGRGVYYQRVSRLRRRALCSARCEQTVHNRRRGGVRASQRVKCCPRCGVEFQAKKSDGLYCSPSCRRKAYRQWGRERPDDPPAG